MSRGTDIGPEDIKMDSSPSFSREGLRHRLPETHKAVTGLPKYVSPTAGVQETTRKRKELQVVGTKEKDSSLTYGRMVVEALRDGQGKSLSTRSILQYVASNYAVPDNFKSYIRASIKKGLTVGWLEAVPSSKTYRLANSRDPLRKEKKTYLTAKKKQALLQKKRSAAMKPDLEDNPYAHPIHAGRKKEPRAFDFVEQDAMLAKAELLAKRAIKIPAPRTSQLKSSWPSSPTTRRVTNPYGYNGRNRKATPELNPEEQAAAAASLALIADLALLEFGDLKSDASVSEAAMYEAVSSSSAQAAQNPTGAAVSASSEESSPMQMPPTPSIKNESVDDSSIAPEPFPLVYDIMSYDDDDDEDDDKMQIDEEKTPKKPAVDARPKLHIMQTRYSHSKKAPAPPATPPARVVSDRISTRLLAKAKGETTTHIMQQSEQLLALAEGKPVPQKSKKRKRSQQSSEAEVDESPSQETAAEPAEQHVEEPAQEPLQPPAEENQSATNLVVVVEQSEAHSAPKRRSTRPPAPKRPKRDVPATKAAAPAKQTAAPAKKVAATPAKKVSAAPAKNTKNSVPPRKAAPTPPRRAAPISKKTGRK